MLTTRHGPQPMLEAFISQNDRGSFTNIYARLPENAYGYLDDMCYVKLSRNRNFPFANMIAELSRSPKCRCNVRFYINPLQGPLDCCSHVSHHFPNWKNAPFSRYLFRVTLFSTCPEHGTHASPPRSGCFPRPRRRSRHPPP